MEARLNAIRGDGSADGIMRAFDDIEAKFHDMDALIRQMDADCVEAHRRLAAPPAPTHQTNSEPMSAKPP